MLAKFAKAALESAGWPTQVQTGRYMFKPPEDKAQKLVVAPLDSVQQKLRWSDGLFRLGHLMGWRK
jgi:hypothetical protein